MTSEEKKQREVEEYSRHQATVVGRQVRDGRLKEMNRQGEAAMSETLRYFGNRKPRPCEAEYITAKIFRDTMKPLK